jgi:hypothetical protein
VVDVRDDGNVSDLLRLLHSSEAIREDSAFVVRALPATR